jgi:hypothetical protein
MGPLMNSVLCILLIRMLLSGKSSRGTGGHSSASRHFGWQRKAKRVHLTVSGIVLGPGAGQEGAAKDPGVGVWLRAFRILAVGCQMIALSRCQMIAISRCRLRRRLRSGLCGE